ncbi:ABC-three component system middle component 1 [Cobetia sp. 1AS1]|uniref:ABC-three component system middle component 1 n=1 Tax=Cobetia sp. 1AS1 TaxID=3040016 RepID=UPI00244D59B2|nr:ABC-three component system middle component 1 [Cobetia sp. 1AS1]MDH2295171.1 hypothetical protein [Cobetia sp. 1AS1]
MNNIIQEIFNSNEFEHHPIGALDLYYHTNSDKTSYWLVTYQKPDDISREQAVWLSKCKKEIKDTALEKNINLLIVWKVDVLSTHTSKVIHHLEEDKFFFKKHVLPYTIDEINDLNKEINATDLRTLLEDKLLSSDTFKAYKDQHLSSGWESLLYRIAIKVPFLKIEHTSKLDMASLEKNITNRIQRSRIKEDLKKLEHLLEQENFDNLVNSKNPDELVKVLMTNS